MDQMPHHYAVEASAQPAGPVRLSADGLSVLESLPPAQFGGPGTHWSPETLLTAAMADCLILTFRAVAQASKLPWTELNCQVTGTLDRVERQTRFTEFHLHVQLNIPAGGDADKARAAVERAEHNCLISNSVSAPKHLEVAVHVE